jgi:hypothetical protein
MDKVVVESFLIHGVALMVGIVAMVIESVLSIPLLFVALTISLYGIHWAGHKNLNDNSIHL